MKTYTETPANYIEFARPTDKDKFVKESFEDQGNYDYIYSRQTGKIVSEEGEDIGYMEEHYTDPGSIDYIYTSVVFYEN